MTANQKLNLFLLVILILSPVAIKIGWYKQMAIEENMRGQ